MKILIVGSDKYWAIENHFFEYFESVPGIEVSLFPAHNTFYEYYYGSLINKIRFRLGLSNIYSRINQDLLDFIDSFQPDVVWVFKGMEVFPSTLKKIKEKGIFLANYNPDHPFVYTHRGSGNRNVLNSVKEYDLHFSYSKKILEEINEKYGIEGEWLPFAYQPLENTPSITKEDINKVCFIGNPDDIRMKMIQYLGQKGLSIDVYGNHWEQYATQFKGYDISIHPPVFHEAFAETVLKYRLQLNIFRPHNIGSHNMRTFEVPAVGGIMLAPYSEEHVLLFEEDQEAFYYRNQEEAFEKAREIIALPAEKALEIKRRAKERSLQSHYTYRDRAKQVLAAFQNVLKV